MGDNLQITLTGAAMKQFLAFKKKLEVETGINLSNVQVIGYLLVYYQHKQPAQA